MSGFVFGAISAEGLSEGFSHHPACIPYCLYGPPVPNGLALFGAIANGIDIFYIGFKKVVDLYTTPQFNATLLEKVNIRGDAGG